MLRSARRRGQNSSALTIFLPADKLDALQTWRRPSERRGGGQKTIASGHGRQFAAKPSVRQRALRFLPGRLLRTLQTFRENRQWRDRSGSRRPERVDPHRHSPRPEDRQAPQFLPRPNVGPTLLRTPRRPIRRRAGPGTVGKEKIPTNAQSGGDPIDAIGACMRVFCRHRVRYFSPHRIKITFPTKS